MPMSDQDKLALYANILRVLAPGGMLINAEQVSGTSSRLQGLFE